MKNASRCTQSELEAWDKRYLWIPSPMRITATRAAYHKSGEGSFLFDISGNRYLDVFHRLVNLTVTRRD